MSLSIRLELIINCNSLLKNKLRLKLYICVLSDFKKLTLEKIALKNIKINFKNQVFSNLNLSNIS